MNAGDFQDSLHYVILVIYIHINKITQNWSIMFFNQNVMTRNFQFLLKKYVLSLPKSDSPFPLIIYISSDNKLFLSIYSM